MSPVVPRLPVSLLYWFGHKTTRCTRWRSSSSCPPRSPKSSPATQRTGGHRRVVTGRRRATGLPEEEQATQREAAREGAQPRRRWRPGGPLAQLTSQRRCGRAVCAGTSVEVQFWEQSGGPSYQKHRHEGVRRLCGERGPQLRSFRTCPPFRRQPLRETPTTSPPMLTGEIEVTSSRGAVQGTWT